MIPAFLVEKFGPLLAKIIFWAVAITLLLAVLGLAKCAYDQRAKTEVKLAKGQAGAAVESGVDAVGVVGNRAQAEAQGDQVVTETQGAVQNASTSAAATDAGRAGLCRLKGYADRPECKETK